MKSTVRTKLVLVRKHGRPRQETDVQSILELERQLAEIRAGNRDAMITQQSLAELMALSRAECIRQHGSVDLRDAVLARAKVLGLGVAP